MIRLAFLLFLLFPGISIAEDREPSHCRAVAQAPGIGYLHKSSFRDPIPENRVRLHYIAHASFLLETHGGLTAVTDFTGFIGNNRPQEVQPPHIDGLRKGVSEGASKPKPKYEFHEGDEVRVVVGAFANFSGTVQEVNADKQKLKVKVSIFGRDTPVELAFSDVEKR